MKHFLLFLACCLFATPTFSQDNIDPNFNFFHDAYMKYEGKHDILKNYNKEFFTSDLYKALNIDEAVYPLYFDSYGSLYPDFNVLKYLNNDSFKYGSQQGGNKNSAYKLQDYTMFGIFQKKSNYDDLKNAIDDLEDPDDKDFYGKLLARFSLGIGNGMTRPKGSIRNGGLTWFEEEFYKEWDSFHLKKQKRFFDIASEYQHVVFYAHGFNNSYSFATIQALEVLERIRPLVPKGDKILLVPIYWRARDKKDAILENGKYVEENLEKLETAAVFLYHFNSAYLTGLGVRELLNHWEHYEREPPEIILYGHSSGATLVTSIFINSVKKLYDKRMGARLTINNCKNQLFAINFPNQTFEKKYRKKFWVNFELFHRYNQIPIPSKFNYKVFLSAASMPGYLTFKELCPENMSNLAFFNIRNKNDKDLNRLNLGGRNLGGLMTLGLDYNDDALEAEKFVLEEKGFFANSPLLENQKVHSILNYINNPVTLKMFSDCIKYQFPHQKKSTR